MHKIGRERKRSRGGRDDTTREREKGKRRRDRDGGSHSGSGEKKKKKERVGLTSRELRGDLRGESHRRNVNREDYPPPPYAPCGDRGGGGGRSSSSSLRRPSLSSSQQLGRRIMRPTMGMATAPVAMVSSPRRGVERERGGIAALRGVGVGVGGLRRPAGIIRPSDIKRTITVDTSSDQGRKPIEKKKDFRTELLEQAAKKAKEHELKQKEKESMAKNKIAKIEEALEKEKEKEKEAGELSETSSSPTLSPPKRRSDAITPERRRRRRSRTSGDLADRELAKKPEKRPKLEEKRKSGKREAIGDEDQVDLSEITVERSPSVSPILPTSYSERLNEDSDYSVPSSPPSPFKRPHEIREEDEGIPTSSVEANPESLGCRMVTEYERLNTIDEGMYGVVHRARDKTTGEIVALKKIKMEQSHSGFPLTSIREITLLLSLEHENIVDVKEVVVDPKSLSGVYMVMEYMEHDLKALMQEKSNPFSTSEVKCLMLQLLKAVDYMHSNWILHRDIKTSNLLLNNKGILKVCDLGMARRYGSPLGAYTSIVVTLWYRAPELLLGAKQYSTAVDIWSVGCVMAEFLTNRPFLPGKNEIDQLMRIFKMLGTPDNKIWPGVSVLPHWKNFKFQQYRPKIRQELPALSHTGKPTLTETGMDLLLQLLTFDPEQRITAKEALNHPWFKESPKPQRTDMMPTFPSLNTQKRRQAILRRRKKGSPSVSTHPRGFALPVV